MFKMADYSEIPFFLNSTSANTTEPEEIKFENPGVISNEVVNVPEPEDRQVTYKGKSVGLKSAIQTIEDNIKRGAPVHYCTRAVSNGLELETNVNKRSGIANPRVMYEQLKQDGWKDIPLEGYTPKFGDVWTYKGKDGQHTAIYGDQWMSYKKEGKDTPYFWNSKDAKRNGHIQRGKNGLVFKAQKGLPFAQFVPISNYNKLFDWNYVTTPTEFLGPSSTTFNDILVDDITNSQLLANSNSVKFDLYQHLKQDYDALHNLFSYKTSTPKPAGKATKPTAPIVSTNYNDTAESKIRYANDAYNVYKSLNLSDQQAIVYAAQDALESTWGQDPSGKNNYGGVKDFSGKGTLRTTHEYENGRMVKKDQYFRDYSDYTSYAKDKARLLRDKYNITGKDSVEQIINKLIKGGYATDKKYRQKIAGTTNSIKRRLQ